MPDDVIEVTERPKPLQRMLLSLDLVVADSLVEELRKILRRLDSAHTRIEALERQVRDLSGVNG
ncbi:MAG: hypothetical protein KGK17_00985 [Betaproteobacteria bacterium]|nr:hypothetical protein [Betaproteobacteria bacterium]